MTPIEKIQSLLNSSEESNIILGSKLAESQLGLGYLDIFEMIGDNFKKSILENADQEETCKMCEEDILGCSRCSVHFICEGCKCEEANEIVIENYIENILS